MAVQINELTEVEAALAARMLIRSEGVGTLASQLHFSNSHAPIHHGPPKHHESNNEKNAEDVTIDMRTLPTELEGYPFALFDYYLDLNTSEGDPIFFTSKLQKSTINLEHNSKATFTVRMNPNDPQFKNNPYATPMSIGRVALVGQVKLIDAKKNQQLIEDAKKELIKRNFDAKWWLDFEDFHFYRLHVQAIYWIGGFGNSHYIGWIGLDLFKNVDTKLLPQHVSTTNSCPCSRNLSHPNSSFNSFRNSKKFHKFSFWFKLLFLLILVAVILIHNTVF